MALGLGALLGIGLGSSFLSGVFGAGSTASANRQNLQIARETNQTNMDIAHMNNEFNKQMLERQIGYNTDMWIKENAYNDPSAQKSRLLQAGFNPYLTGNIQGGQSANVGSITTPTASPVTAQGATMQAAPVPDIGAVISTMLDQYSQQRMTDSQIAKMDAETKQVIIDNQTRAAKNIQELRSIMAKTKSDTLRNHYQKIVNTYARDMMEQDYLNKVQTNKNLRLQGESMGLTIAMQEKQLEYLPQQLRLGIAMHNAQIYSEYQRGKLTSAQMEHELKKAIQTEAQTQGIKLNNKVLCNSVDALVRKNRAEADHAYNNRGADSPWKETENYGKFGRAFSRGIFSVGSLIPFSSFR